MPPETDLTLLTILFSGFGTGLLAILYQQVREYRGMRRMFEGFAAGQREINERIQQSFDKHAAGQREVNERLLGLNDRVVKVLERLEAGRGAAI